ncbi:conserved hypothetical protein [Rhodopseudomonas palustris HaA2]|uniref:Alkaline proteinase inhibitor/ Outer membrane lipoprotein Omp19 domain-containing protein n=1 Tax=Rhodopseudomonas palustris (strain HaA2) TaxID=316058 RepID=Q2J2M5_RHOP2|nr:AprI/Inh family metalloprotease inhibitor [Rhodopseudomonas palustris]ABD05285.1 conserved hypothetical protein [Rhodopseudomonas palustris HaA2]
MRRCVTAAMLLLLSAAPAPAQDAAALTKAMVGQWELSTTERSRTCVVTLKPEAAAPGIQQGAQHGMKLELEPGCAAALPFTKDIAVWTVKGLDIVRLENSAGEAVIDFTEVESGIFEGLRANEGVYILQNLVAARSLAKSMDQMIGDWSMVRGSGRAVCGLTLTNNEAATADNFEAFLKPRCDSLVANFGPTMWRLERGALMLIAPSGEVWRFEADDNAQWRKTPDSADPLIMLRQ